jgi:hypothetical protein
MLMMQRSTGQAILPLGCFLALATPIVVFFGRALWLGYLGWADVGAWVQLRSVPRLLCLCSLPVLG